MAGGESYREETPSGKFTKKTWTIIMSLVYFTVEVDIYCRHLFFTEPSF